MQSTSEIIRLIVRHYSSTGHDSDHGTARSEILFAILTPTCGSSQPKPGPRPLCEGCRPLKSLPPSGDRPDCFMEGSWFNCAVPRSFHGRICRHCAQSMIAPFLWRAAQNTPCRRPGVTAKLAIVITPRPRGRTGWYELLKMSRCAVLGASWTRRNLFRVTARTINNRTWSDRGAIHTS